MQNPDPMTEILPAKPGQRLARGVTRMLSGLGHAALAEFVPAGGLRVDVISVSPRGEIWVVECKSCRADFTADRKWQGYLEFCDRFFWAVDADFPEELLPEGSGLIRADSWGAELVRMGPETRLAGARRSRLLRDIARVSTTRLLALTDPLGISGAAS
ncbi:MmcB family DNA repair protein [Paracoccus binzhouensis]|uniref:MmcB family DNA repair protein n=1 Tax=Paracoccus binzhouensis TaxID=2796149 RepID=UPI001E36F381|nr:MmcB family DNA repair protein [Paracoccus binzhouensis]